MTKNKHEIELRPFQEWYYSAYKTYAESIGTTVRKELRCYLNGTIAVFKNHDIIWQGRQLVLALEVYNDI